MFIEFNDCVRFNSFDAHWKSIAYHFRIKDELSENHVCRWKNLEKFLIETYFTLNPHDFFPLHKMQSNIQYWCALNKTHMKYVQNMCIYLWFHLKTGGKKCTSGIKISAEFQRKLSQRDKYQELVQNCVRLERQPQHLQSSDL